ncbi:Galactosyldiacylglycerol synthase [Candidatus Hydrogenisulfobacillus filiaventi]|uniref:Galactosyldiacylglycerol synthase n=1 Tax=Candidatus Hydrogenisulfobacillus filiaventi TaxID=2707344 RepID=A0A6F8ZEN3_9FIRM|nr:Galactosyldiacylglycerol synthase [Candidatus Hydrogenisulfobacillus filiaventi]
METDWSASTRQLAEWVDWLPDHHQATLAMRPDVLILAARFGEGHMRAAKAVALQLLRAHPDLRLGLLDYYRFVNPPLDHTIRWAYMSSVRFAPRLWRWFYTSTQRIDPEGPTQTWINHIGMGRFWEAVRVHPPRVIVSTFPTAAGVVSTLKQQGRLGSANYVVITDYSVHSQWIHPAVDRYFVGSEDVARGLAGRGVPEERITVSGIPVDERFREPVDVAAVRRTLALGEEPLVLFMGGSYMPPSVFVKVLRAIDSVPAPFTLLVGAGHERARRQEAEAVAQGARHRMLVRGFVNNVHELMAAAQVLITKAGGLTTTEALCVGLPTIIYRPIPGQEDANALFLTRHGAGLRARSAEEVGLLLHDLLTHPARLAHMAERSRALGHPEAAATVAAAVWDAFSRNAAHVGA